MPPPVSQKFRWQANDMWNKPSVGMKVTVQDEDCLVASKRLIDAGMNPAVLNLADILKPGGCVEASSGGQEESIFRRSNYNRTLTEDHYPSRSLTALQIINCFGKSFGCCGNGSAKSLHRETRFLD